MRARSPAPDSASSSEASERRREEEMPEWEEVEERGELWGDEEARDASSRESRVGAAE